MASRIAGIVRARSVCSALRATSCITKAGAARGGIFSSYPLSSTSSRFSSTFVEGPVPTTNPPPPSVNPLLLPTLHPRFDLISASHVVPAVEAAVSQLERQFTSLEKRLGASSSSSWSLMEQLEVLRDELSRISSIVSHIVGVASTPAFRDAHAAALPSIVRMNTRMAQSPEVFQALRTLLASMSVAATPTNEKEMMMDSRNRRRNTARRRAVEIAVRQAELSGVGLDPARRARFNDLLVELSDLSQRFDNNVLASTAAFRMLLTTKEEVAGLPKALLQQYASAAAAADKSTSSSSSSSNQVDADRGPWLITLDGSSYRPFLQHSDRADLREKLHYAMITRASCNEARKKDESSSTTTTTTDNGPILHRILAGRQELASLLGYANYAEVSLASKMAGQVHDVASLIERLRIASMPSAEKEMEALAKFAAKVSSPSSTSTTSIQPLAHYDIPYWSEKLRKSQYDVDDEAIRAYFPLPVVLEGLFEVLEHVFGVKVVQQTGVHKPPVWDPNVQFYNVYDTNDSSIKGGTNNNNNNNNNNTTIGKHIASFYLDPYARSGTKRGGAWADICVNRSTNPLLPPLLQHNNSSNTYIQSGRSSGGYGVGGHGIGTTAGRKVPIVYLVLNCSPPSSPSEPALLRHTDVTTLYHEMGHGLQIMLTTVDEGDVAGISGVEWDAVELPSQMIEEFAYEPGVLKRMSKHVSTGQSLPVEIIEKLRGARNHMAATAMLRQLRFAYVDMALHAPGLATTIDVSKGKKEAAASPSSPQVDAFALDNATARVFTPPTPYAPVPLSYDRFLCAFTHIFSGGYAAGYYSYKFAEVMSADAYGAFVEAGLNAQNPAQHTTPTNSSSSSSSSSSSMDSIKHPAVAKVGRAFRATVLGLGGSEHPGEVFREFRGRNPDIGPLLKQYGLV